MIAHTPASRRQPRQSLWKGTDYGWWLGADTGGTVASGIADFALPLITLAVTHSSTLASSIETLLIGTQTVLSLAGGVIADRYDRKRLVIAWALSGAILFGAATAIDLAGGLTIGLILTLAILLGARAGLLGQASNAMLRGIVPDTLLPHALALNSARDATVNLVSGPLSSLLMTVSHILPLVAGALADAIAFLCALPITRYWRRNRQPRPTAGKDAKDDAGTPPTLRDAFDGLAWMIRNHFQRRLLLAAAITTGAANAFLLVTTMHVSDNGTNMLPSGFVNAIAAAGMLAGSALAARLIDRVPSGVLIGGMFALLAVGFAGAAVFESPGVKAAFVLVSVLLLPAGNAAVGGLQNILVGKDKLGRISAAGLIAQYGSYALMAVLCGWAMDVWGYVAVCFALAALIVLGAAICLTTRALVTMPTPDRWSDHIAKWHIESF